MFPASWSARPRGPRCSGLATAAAASFVVSPSETVASAARCAVCALLVLSASSRGGEPRTPLLQAHALLVRERRVGEPVVDLGDRDAQRADPLDQPVELRLEIGDLDVLRRDRPQRGEPRDRLLDVPDRDLARRDAEVPSFA